MKSSKTDEPVYKGAQYPPPLGKCRLMVVYDSIYHR